MREYIYSPVGREFQHWWDFVRAIGELFRRRSAGDREGYGDLALVQPAIIMIRTIVLPVQATLAGLGRCARQKLRVCRNESWASECVRSEAHLRGSMRGRAELRLSTIGAATIALNGGGQRWVRPHRKSGLSGLYRVCDRGRLSPVALASVRPPV